MQLRVLFLQRRKQVGKVTEGKFRVESAGDVQLSCAFSNSPFRYFQTVVDVVCVSVGLSRRAIETAKFAIGVTDIRRIEMSIDVEIGRAAMSSSSHDVGQLSESGKIVGGVERE